MTQGSIFLGLHGREEEDFLDPDVVGDQHDSPVDA